MACGPCCRSACDSPRHGTSEVSSIFKASSIAVAKVKTRPVTAKAPASDRACAAAAACSVAACITRAASSGTAASWLRKCVASANVMPSSARASRHVVWLLVAGTARSTPAAVTKARSTALASGLSASLVTATVRAPHDRAQVATSVISSVRPDWEHSTTNDPASSCRTWYSVAIDGAPMVAGSPATISTR